MHPSPANPSEEPPHGPYHSPAKHADDVAVAQRVAPLEAHAAELRALASRTAAERDEAVRALNSSGPTIEATATARTQAEASARASARASEWCAGSSSRGVRGRFGVTNPAPPHTQCAPR